MAIEKALDPTIIDSTNRKLKKVAAPSPKIGGRPNSNAPNNGSNNNNNSNISNNNNNSRLINEAMKRPELKRGESVLLSKGNNSNSANPFADQEDVDTSAPKVAEPPSPSKSSRAAVTGGSAKAFNPSAIASSSSIRGNFFGGSSSNGESDDWTAPADGVFIDRTMQERLIEQVSESEAMNLTH
jgi:hypothetical protein